jgi:hypothetical protein
LVRVYCRIERLAYNAAYQQAKRRDRERRMNFVSVHGWAVTIQHEFWPQTPQGYPLEKWHPPIKWLTHEQQQETPADEYMPAILETEKRQGVARLAAKEKKKNATPRPVPPHLPAVRLPPPKFYEPPRTNQWEADTSVRSSWDNSVRAKWWDSTAFWDAAIADHSKVYWGDADTSVTGQLPAPSSYSGGVSASHPTMWQWDESRGEMCKWDWSRYPDYGNMEPTAHMSYVDKWHSEIATGLTYDWNGTAFAAVYTQWDADKTWDSWTTQAGWDAVAQSVRWEEKGWVDFDRARKTTRDKMTRAERTRSETPSL